MSSSSSSSSSQTRFPTPVFNECFMRYWVVEGPPLRSFLIWGYEASFILAPFHDVKDFMDPLHLPKDSYLYGKKDVLYRTVRLTHKGKALEKAEGELSDILDAYRSVAFVFAIDIGRMAWPLDDVLRMLSMLNLLTVVPPSDDDYYTALLKDLIYYYPIASSTIFKGIEGEDHIESTSRNAQFGSYLGFMAQLDQQVVHELRTIHCVLFILPQKELTDRRTPSQADLIGAWQKRFLTDAHRTGQVEILNVQTVKELETALDTLKRTYTSREDFRDKTFAKTVRVVLLVDPRPNDIEETGWYFQYLEAFDAIVKNPILNDEKDEAFEPLTVFSIFKEDIRWLLSNGEMAYANTMGQKHVPDYADTNFFLAFCNNDVASPESKDTKLLLTKYMIDPASAQALQTTKIRALKHTKDNAFAVIDLTESEPKQAFFKATPSRLYELLYPASAKTSKKRPPPPASFATSQSSDSAPPAQSSEPARPTRSSDFVLGSFPKSSPPTFPPTPSLLLPDRTERTTRDATPPLILTDILTHAMVKSNTTTLRPLKMYECGGAGHCLFYSLAGYLFDATGDSMQVERQRLGIVLRKVAAHYLAAYFSKARPPNALTYVEFTDEEKKALASTEQRTSAMNQSISAKDALNERVNSLCSAVKDACDDQLRRESGKYRPGVLNTAVKIDDLAADLGVVFPTATEAIEFMAQVLHPGERVPQPFNQVFARYLAQMANSNIDCGILEIFALSQVFGLDPKVLLSANESFMALWSTTSVAPVDGYPVAEGSRNQVVLLGVQHVTEETIRQRKDGKETTTITLYPRTYHFRLLLPDVEGGAYTDQEIIQLGQEAASRRGHNLAILASTPYNTPQYQLTQNSHKKVDARHLLRADVDLSTLCQTVAEQWAHNHGPNQPYTTSATSSSRPFSQPPDKARTVTFSTAMEDIKYFEPYPESPPKSHPERQVTMRDFEDYEDIEDFEYVEEGEERGGRRGGEEPQLDMNPFSGSGRSTPTLLPSYMTQRRPRDAAIFTSNPLRPLSRPVPPPYNPSNTMENIQRAHFLMMAQEAADQKAQEDLKNNRGASLPLKKDMESDLKDRTGTFEWTTPENETIPLTIFVDAFGKATVRVDKELPAHLYVGDFTGVPTLNPNASSKAYKLKGSPFFIDASPVGKDDLDDPSLGGLVFGLSPYIFAREDDVNEATLVVKHETVSYGSNASTPTVASYKLPLYTTRRLLKGERLLLKPRVEPKLKRSTQTGLTRWSDKEDGELQELEKEMDLALSSLPNHERLKKNLRALYASIAKLQEEKVQRAGKERIDTLYFFQGASGKKDLDALLKNTRAIPYLSDSWKASFEKRLVTPKDAKTPIWHRSCDCCGGSKPLAQNVCATCGRWDDTIYPKKGGLTKEKEKEDVEENLGNVDEYLRIIATSGMSKALALLNARLAAYVKLGGDASLAEAQVLAFVDLLLKNGSSAKGLSKTALYLATHADQFNLLFTL